VGGWGSVDLVGSTVRLGQVGVEIAKDNGIVVGESTHGFIKMREVRQAFSRGKTSANDSHLLLAQYQHTAQNI
jgi:hypothetical protein